MGALALTNQLASLFGTDSIERSILYETVYITICGKVILLVQYGNTIARIPVHHGTEQPTPTNIWLSHDFSL